MNSYRLTQSYDTYYVKVLMLSLMLLLLLSPLVAFELSAEMGYTRNTMSLSGDAPDAAPDLEALEAKAFIGLSAKQKISERMMLGGKLIYNRRDYSIEDNDLTASAGYLDLMLHPAIRIYPLQIYGGPTFAFNLNSTSSGLDPWHNQAVVEKFTGIIPGLHAGIRFPDDHSLPLTLDLSYNLDLMPYSEAFDRDKYQQRMNMGIVLKLVNSSNRLEGLWWAFNKIPAEIRSGQGLMVSTEKDNFVFAYNPSFELAKRLGPVAIGGDISIPAGSIMLEKDFGMLISMMAGPHLGLKFGFLEPYAKLSWGVSSVFIFAEDHPDSGLYPATAQQYGLRFHVADDLSLDMYYRSQNYIRDKEVGTFGLGVNIDPDL